MSEYIKHTWADGEVIDSDKLNNIETGIAEAKKEAEQVTLVKDTAERAETAAEDAKTDAANAQAAAENADAEAKKAASDAQKNLTAHNTDTAAHNDLRTELQAMADRLNAILDSDDETLDELSEIVAYIKSNKALIDAITTSKVNVSDIVNDLVTNVANKPLSAAQGVVLKGLIDTLQTAVNGKAPASHGNHVPTTETANNARFLRNDNTWQTVTPANIGLKTEPWTFTVEKDDGTEETVTKAVYVG